MAELPSFSPAMSRRIGVLGGGQLGLMLMQEAISLGLDVSFMDADPLSPCKRFYSQFTQASITDREAVVVFGVDKDVLTIEIENVSAEGLAQLEQAGKAIYPQPHVIALIQDKLAQKQFYQLNHIPTMPFVEVNSLDDIRANRHILPAFNKLARGGYDGKGVQFIQTEADILSAFDAHGFLEEPAQISKEICMIVARSTTGQVECFPSVESVYYAEANMVDYLISPADIDKETEAEAQKLAVRVAEALGIVGILAVEMFLTPGGELLVNECAPRPHNTGHHTIEACNVSQYGQHLRAILGLPLLKPEAYRMAAMVNLVGEPGHSGEARYKGLEDVLAMSGAYLHLYGKAQTRPYRKMGHITVLGASRAEVEEKVAAVKEAVRVVAG